MTNAVNLRKTREIKDQELFVGNDGRAYERFSHPIISLRKIINS